MPGLGAVLNDKHPLRAPPHPPTLPLPARWAHYTEGLSFNMSLTWRYGAAGSGPAAE